MWVWLNAEEEAGPDDEAGIRLTEYKKEGKDPDGKEEAEEVSTLYYLEFRLIPQKWLYCVLVCLRLQRILVS